MIACIMGKLETVKELVEHARMRLKPEEFKFLETGKFDEVWRDQMS